MYISGFNGVQSRDESVKKRAADVDTQLQRRYDLIPNLVSSVKGYMQFERQTLEDIPPLDRNGCKLQMQHNVLTWATN